MQSEFDSILIVSFGGPEKKEDVMPFLKNVLKGKNVPEHRMLEVAEHYYHFGGKSPINEQNRALISALKNKLAQDGPNLPVYFGNRNWHPTLPEALEQMQRDGRKKSLAFFTSVFSSYSGCRQYRENIIAARQQIGDSAPEVSKVRMPYNHPGFIEVMQQKVAAAKKDLPDHLADQAAIVFSAHSIPLSMAKNCKYEEQLHESSKLVAAAFAQHKYQIAYQSRSGSPHVPWLEPDISQAIKNLHAQKVPAVIVVPIGFTSDHMEVMFDLDVEARKTAEDSGIAFARAGTAGTDPKFIQTIRDLIFERWSGSCQRPSIGSHGPCHDICPVDCCLPG